MTTVVDAAPTAVDDAATVSEDSGATAIAVLANDTDPDGGPKAIVATTNAAHGTVAITGGGSGLTYAPAPNYCNDPPGTTPDSFTYTLNGGSTATVRVKVTCVDDYPTAVADAATVAEDSGATTIDVLANDTDPDGGPKTVAAKTNPAHGTAAIGGAGSSVTYQPNANYCNNPPGTSPDTFTYTLNGGSTATVSVTVTCVNDAPVAVGDGFSTNQDSSLLVVAPGVLANDTDVDGDSLTAVLVSGPAHASSFTLSGDGSFTYTPTTGFHGSDSFTYKANDGKVDSAPATVSITVQRANAVPVAADQSASTNEDTAKQITLSASDADDDPLTFSIVDGPSNGGLGSIGAADCSAVNVCTATVTYTPAANYNGPDAFTFRANDSLTDSNTATVSLTVTAVNDAPVLDTSKSPALNAEDEDAAAPVGAVGTPVSSLVDFATPAGGLDNVTDVDAGALLGIALTGADTASGTWFYSLDSGSTWTPLGSVSEANARLLAANASNRLYFQPSANFNGTITSALTFRAWDRTSGSDGGLGNATLNGGATAFSTAGDSASLVINSVDDAPTATNLSAPETYTEDTPLNLIDIVVSDVDNANVTATLTLSNPAVGSLSTGTSGAATSTYNAGTGVWTASGALADVNTLLAGVVFTPTANANGNFTIATSVSDGTLSVGGSKAVTGVAVNDAPTATNLSAAETYTEDTPLNLIDIVVSDVDSANVTATLTLSNPAVGSLSTGTSGAVTSTYNAGTGVWTASGALADVNTLLAGVVFTPTANANGNFTIATSVSDGALSVTGSKAVTGIAVNDAPVLDASKSPSLAAENEDAGAPAGAVGTLVSSLVDFASPSGQLDNVTDVDSSALLGIAVTAADTANGSWFYSTDNGANWQALGAVTNTSARLLAADANSRLFFQPNANFNGTLATAITFRAWDRTSGTNGALADTSTNGGATAFSSATDTASLVINPVNDAPVLDASKNPALNAENEDAGAPAGAVGTLVSSLVDFAAPAGQVDNVTDVDTGALLGIALTAADTASGSWFYSTNNGTTWTALGAVSTSNARLLAANANNRLFFQPSANFNGTISGAITFRAWDQTSGTDGGVANTTTNGGTTAFSVATDTASLVINAVADPPVAQDKSFNAQANMKIVGLTGLTAGATDPDDGFGGCVSNTFTVNSTSATSPAGGTVTVTDASAGTFDFTPPPGVTGNVTFTYTIADTGCPTGSTSAPATVTINVAGPVIWFVNSAAATNGTGTLTSPFNVLSSADAVDTVNQGIFLYSSATNYTGALTLNSGEKLIGQGTTGTTFDSVFGISPPTGTVARPTLGSGTATLTGTLTLAGSTKLRGLALSTGASNGLVGSGGISGVDLDQVSVTTTTGTAVNLNNATGTYVFSSVSTSGAANGILLDTLGTSIVTVNGGSIVNASTRGIDINAGSGNYSFANSITTTGTGRSVEVTNRTGGTVAFSGSVSDTGIGISLSSNTGATVNFTGGLTASTGTNSAFSATGGGTVNVTGSANTLTTTTGTALDVESTTIGASNLTFQSITANGGSHGIVLISTGSSGGLTVSGTGSAGTGGSITGITGADLATNNCGDLGSTAPVGVGVYLKSTSSPSFSWMNFTGTFGNFGILGYTVNGFTLDHASMTGTFGDNVNVDDDTVHFCGLTGSATISNSTISNGAESNLRVVNASGTLNRITLQSDTFGLNQTNGGGGTLIEADGGTTNVTVLDSTFQGSRGTPFDAISQTGATMDLVFGQPGHGNTIHNTHSNIVPFAQDLAVTPTGTETFDINSNHFDSASAVQAQGGVFINAALGTATATGYFRNNTIGTSGVANSGSSGNDPGLDIESNGGGDLTIKIDNNQMYQWGSNGAGFYVQVGQTFGNPTNVNITATNNTVAEPGTFAVANTAQGFQLNAGTGTGDAPSICLGFSSNTIDQAGTGAGGDVRLRQRFDSHVALPGYTGPQDGVTGSPTVNSFVAGLNSPTPTVTSISSTAAGGGFFNTPGPGTACALPGF
jgi:hypothetical protein